ncbi:DUF932 domain-containing protein [Ralstonia sp. 22086]|uniref:DUF932 domain-containing protein n=1 Tax=Ralstonia sp. 22086 TaxID=3453870 RepID=UPI003F87B291
MHLVRTMAYTGETPWHGLGNRLARKQPIEVWARQAGMDWQIEETPVCFMSGQAGALGTIHSFPEQKVLYRSDTKAPLSVVSNRYQVVQPAEILEFYRDLTEAGGFELETAGVLKDGKKLWALAKTGQQTVLKGGDTVNGYLLLATACDGTLATTAQFTSVRVVCNNTLAIALADGTGAVKVPHRTQFNPQAVKQQLGIAVASWDSFMVRMRALSERKVRPATAHDFFRRLLDMPSLATIESKPQPNDRALRAIQALYDGKGMGADLPSAAGTAWGLVNAVTQYADHERRARSADHRLDSAWFGVGANLKQRAWDEALKLVA